MCAMRSGPDLCFLCDQNLGRLARWLRILGFDAEYMHGYDQGRIDRAIADGRIVLTRKSSLAGRRSVLVIRHDRVHDQLLELGGTFDLSCEIKAFSRCSLCNTLLVQVPRDEVKGLVPDYVHATHEAFARCPSCGRIYWKGTHFTRACDRMRSTPKGC